MEQRWDLVKEWILSLWVIVAFPLFFSLWNNFVWAMWWRPRRIRKVFEEQKVPCLPSRSLYGNLPQFLQLNRDARALPMPTISHDIGPRIMPHLFEWSKTYGASFVYWMGYQARFTLTEPEQAKDILSINFGSYQKPKGRPTNRDLAGYGLTALEGEMWENHRRIMNPAFFPENIKAMIPTMVACTIEMIVKWESGHKTVMEIDVQEELQMLTADIIAHTSFGSSYKEGKQVFEMQHEQQVFFQKDSSAVYIPGSRFLPTAENRYRWKLKRKIYKILSQLVTKRLECSDYGNDLLGLMIASNKGKLQGNRKKLRMGLDEIINECKTFFFAGHETTSTLLTWTFLLLASNPDWQERVREEVLTSCGLAELPMAESINRLKVVGMVLNEALRLYPPAVALFRTPVNDTRLGNVTIPAGTILVVPILLWHHDQQYWGQDANDFNPERFAQGIPKASTVSGAFMPFSIGPRNCIGQTFAMLEAKIVLSLILRQYRFHVSPKYRHAPTIIVTIKPQFGMPLVFEKIQDHTGQVDRML